MKYRSILTHTVAVLLPTVALFAALRTQAATYVWDATPGTTGAQDGTTGGIWQTGIGNWYNSTAPSDDQLWANGNDAVFGAGVGSAAGTITLGGAVTANSLTFNPTASGTYTIAGTAGNPLTLTTGNITANASAAISAAIAGSNGLTLSGTATLTLNGANANTYTGLTTVNGGTLALAKSAGVTTVTGNLVVTAGTVSLGAAEQIADSSVITLSGGTINFNGRAETIAGINMSGGTFNIGTSSAPTGATTVTGAVSVTGGTLSAANGNLIISGLATINGGTINTTTGSVAFNGGLAITGGLSSGFTLNSGGTASASSITISGTGGILLGGASASVVSTLTIGSGGLTMTGQGITVNPATGAGQLGTRIVLNGDFTGSGSNNIALNTGTPVAGAFEEIAIGSATRIFNILNGSTNIGLNIVGPGGSLIKAGSGTLTLVANNTYSGSTTVAGGSLLVTGTDGRLSNTTGVSVTGGGIFQIGSPTVASNEGVVNRVNAAAGLTLGGTSGSGTLTMAYAAVSTSQTLASLALGVGANVINTVNTPAGALGLTFTGTAGGAGYTRVVGSSVNIVNSAGFTVTLGNTLTAAGGSSVSGTGVDAILIGATLNGLDFISPQAGLLTAATYTDTGTTIWTAGKNMNVTGNVSATAGTAINSLRFGTAGAFTVSLAGSTTIDSGMILVNSNVGAVLSTISGGTLRGSAGGDLLILQYNTATGGDLTISSVIADNGAATSLTKAGGGLVTLSGTNTYTGPTYLNGGTISIANNAALGATATGASLVFDGGTLQTTATMALETASAIRLLILNAGGGTLSPTTGTLTVNGLIFGNGALTKTGAGTLLLPNFNLFAGGMTLNGGVLQFSNNSAFGTGPLSLTSGTLQGTVAARTVDNALFLRGSSTISGTQNITFTNTTTVTSVNATVASSISGGTLLFSGPMFLSTGTTTTSRQLTMAGTGSTEISGIIADNDSGSAVANGVTLNGGGTLKLSGINTYTGRTIVATGTIVVNQDRNFGAAPASPLVDAVMIAQNGTFRIDTGFTLNVNRSVGIGQSTGGASVGTIQVATGQTFTVAGTVADRTVNANGTVIPTAYGSLIKSGAGTLVLAGANTYSGSTTVSAGTLVVSGSLNAASVGGAAPARAITVATAATLQLSGAGSMTSDSLTLNNTSTLSLEIGAATANKITLTGAATLNGQITLTLGLTADPTDGTLFTLIDGGSARLGSGLFSYAGNSLTNNSTFTVSNGGFTQQFQINYSGGSDGNDVVLLAVPEPGAAPMLLAATMTLLGLFRFRPHSPRRSFA